jgi:serum/glucocorticoid-regulated kinase 2
MYDSILHDPLELPEDFFPDTTSILAGLLDRDPLKRLGAKGADEIKQHPFFHSINWNE